MGKDGKIICCWARDPHSRGSGWVGNGLLALARIKILVVNQDEWRSHKCNARAKWTGFVGEIDQTKGQKSIKGDSSSACLSTWNRSSWCIHMGKVSF